jgi:predicted RNase H-like HicB family nuclease
MMLKVINYTVLIERGCESGYVARVPALRGCVSQGVTTSETVENVKEAIEAYIEALIADGIPVPVE